MWKGLIPTVIFHFMYCLIIIWSPHPPERAELKGCLFALLPGLQPPLTPCPLTAPELQFSHPNLLLRGIFSSSKLKVCCINTDILLLLSLNSHFPLTRCWFQHLSLTSPSCLPWLNSLFTGKEIQWGPSTFVWVCSPFNVLPKEREQKYQILI